MLPSSTNTGSLEVLERISKNGILSNTLEVDPAETWTKQQGCVKIEAHAQSVSQWSGWTDWRFATQFAKLTTSSKV